MNDVVNTSSGSNLQQGLDAQMNVCLLAIKKCDHAVQKCHWDKLTEHGKGVSHEMEKLKHLLVGFSGMGDDMLNRLRYLDIQMRRTQRQLTLHINAAASDLSTLDNGIKKAKMIGSMLQA